MSAQYPNVPDLPGVPPIARPEALQAIIQTASAGSLNGALGALTALGVNDTVAANVDLLASKAAALSGIPAANAIYSAGSDIVGGLTGAVANADSALDALASGDINGAIASAERTYEAAERAYNSISEIINPVPTEALTDSGDGSNEDPTDLWGAYTKEGDLAFPYDNVVLFENSLEARISDYPIEKGSFASYNKVIAPFEVRMVMTRGGSVDERADFLDKIQTAWQSTDLFDVVTPETVYLDVNLVGVRRVAAADRGVGLMAIETIFRKVRQTATLAFSSTKDPSGQQENQNGSVQAQTTDDLAVWEGASI